jgi:hypothetical protein
MAAERMQVAEQAPQAQAQPQPQLESPSVLQQQESALKLVQQQQQPVLLSPRQPCLWPAHRRDQ